MEAVAAADITIHIAAQTARSTTRITITCIMMIYIVAICSSICYTCLCLLTIAAVTSVCAIQ